MEQKKHICASICDGLPTLFANHPWWVHHYQMLRNNEDHIIYTMREPPSQHRYQIPSSHGKCIQGCFHGWVILSNHPYNDMWSLWNPVTSKIIRLPRLISEKGDRECCLSSPPDYHGSIFMLTTKKPTIVFCRLDRRRKRYKWVEMSYAKQMRSIVGCDGFLDNLTCCNGKVYALSCIGNRLRCVILVDIEVKGTEIVISLSWYLKHPTTFYMDGHSYTIGFFKGCCSELFFVKLGVIDDAGEKTVCGVYVYKLDTKNIRWERMEDLKGAAIFLDLSQHSMFYSPAIGSELGGYVHLLDKSGKVIQSYDYKNKTVALSIMPTPYASSAECRLRQEEDSTNNSNNTTIEGENMESRLLNIPFDVLKTIMEFCVGVEYLNFRAVCKKCHLAAPMIRWSKGGRLQTYSLVSPLLMVLDQDRRVTSFTDPMFGDRYFIKTPRELIGDVQIHCSMYGWLLIERLKGPLLAGQLMFFNPFTSDIRELPDAPRLDTYCFSAPPTSSECMVVGFTTRGEWHVFVYFVAREPSWRSFRLLNFSGDSSRSFRFATLYARNLYALYNNGGLDFIDTDNEHYTWRKVLAKGPNSSDGSLKQNFLMKCDQQLLLVTMSEFGGRVDVFKLNNDSTEWEKTENLGKYAIYIYGKSCLCMEAKMPTMANKIYFPRVHSDNWKIVFYSLETRRYHTSNIEESFVNFMGTTYHLNPHAWIEPSWS
ncbi:hypothetical protein HanXRQr2_Chr02g0073021 [Helianthus annuus]|uniref:F-box domain-containing protein n=2 Tax=Helianthus annuus TaxID=4232 RepID=A0A9K3JQ06_HELAN|nr:uncharacterized protein LOC110922857 [Helianthus annuus]KAF5819032.1 hypothetical protein HanXRQr2_Chr02g0073021 [Helianthus annuus]